MSAATRLRHRFRQLPEGDPVPSPCVSVCRMDERTGWCEGCLRTLEEIGAWSDMAEAPKRQLWQALDQRALALTAKLAATGPLADKEKRRP